MARKSNKVTVDLDEVFIEPSLMQKLFPTFVKKSSGSSKNKKGAKSKRKPAKKRRGKKHTEQSLHLPLVNMLPGRLMMEVRRKRAARVFAGVYAVVILAAGGVFFSNFTDISIANNQLTSAEQRLAGMTSNYSDVAPDLRFSRELRQNATLANNFFSRQVNYSQVLTDLGNSAAGVASITNAAVVAGGSDEVQCTTGVDDPFAATAEQAPNTGCMVFSGVADTLGQTAELNRRLESVPGFVSVFITPGEPDSEQRIPFQGVVGLSPDLTRSGEVLIDVSQLPNLQPQTTTPAGTPNGEAAGDNAGNEVTQ